MSSSVGALGSVASFVSSVEQQLRQAATDLIKVGVRFAVVGGLAVSARAEPRLTRDADFAVAVASDEEAGRRSNR